MTHRFNLASWPLVLLLLALLGCDDPCKTLAKRICNCEPTTADRNACTQDRITNQQQNIEINEADREFCAQKLETCDCAAVDQNDLEKCGFVKEDAE